MPVRDGTPEGTGPPEPQAEERHAQQNSLNTNSPFILLHVFWPAKRLHGNDLKPFRLRFHKQTIYPIPQKCSVPTTPNPLTFAPRKINCEMYNCPLPESRVQSSKTQNQDTATSLMPPDAQSTVPLQLAANNSPQVTQMKRLQEGINQSTQVQQYRRQQQGANQPVVQRYRDLDAEDYELEGESETEHFFTTQSKELQYEEPVKGKYTIGHDVERSNEKQGLRIAEDNSMAIHKTAREAKEFYAVQDVLDNSNKILEKINSQVKLEKSGSLSISTEGENLHKVTPVSSLEEQEIQAGKFAELISHICIDMASGVMGKPSWSHEAVFQEQGKGNQHVANVQSTGEFGDKNIGSLALGLVDAEEGVDVKEMRDQMVRDPYTEKPGERYGTALGNGELNGKSKTMGINEYARPKVGEAYATYSMFDESGIDRAIDYATGGDPQEALQHVWGYHYAAVVAESLDRGNTVTLENYNRDEDQTAQLHNILVEVVEANSVALKDVYEQVKPQEKYNKGDLQSKFMTAYQAIHQESVGLAQSRFLDIKRSFDSSQSWFFQMQGQGEGQSFHEQQKESGGHVNPLTLRVRPHNADREKKRTDAIAVLNSFPAIPTTIAAQPVYGDYRAALAFWKGKVLQAETVKEIGLMKKRAMEEVGKALVSSTAAVMVHLAQGNGVTIPEDSIGAVIGSTSFDSMAKAAEALGVTCYYAVEDGIQQLWIYETEKHMAMSLASANIIAAWRYVPVVRNYVEGN
jgi:hypothetical protein